MWKSNPRPFVYKTNALPTELTGLLCGDIIPPYNIVNMALNTFNIIFNICNYLQLIRIKDSKKHNILSYNFSYNFSYIL